MSTNERRPFAPRAPFSSKSTGTEPVNPDLFIQNQDAVWQNGRFKISGYGTVGNDATHSVMYSSAFELHDVDGAVMSLSDTTLRMNNGAPVETVLASGSNTSYWQANFGATVGDSYALSSVEWDDDSEFEWRFGSGKPLRVTMPKARLENCSNAQLLRTNSVNDVVPAWSGTEVSKYVYLDASGNVVPRAVSSVASDLAGNFIQNQGTATQNGQFRINGRGTWTVDGDESVYIDSSVIHLEDHSGNFDQMDIRSDSIHLFDGSVAETWLGTKSSTVRNTGTQSQAGFSILSHVGPSVDFPEVYAKSDASGAVGAYTSLRPGLIEFGEVQNVQRMGFYVTGASTVEFGNLLGTALLSVDSLKVENLSAVPLGVGSSGTVMDGTTLIAKKFRRLGAAPAFFTPTNDEGRVWVPYTTEASEWFSVAGGNGVLISVAVTGTNRIMRSLDNGESWVAQAAPEALRWRDITYGNGVWLAVALDGTNQIMRSVDDGVTWTQSAAPEVAQWSTCAYINGTFLIAALDGVTPFYYSTDGGVSWTASTIPYTSWRGIGVSDSTVIAVSGNGNIFRSVDNGKTFTEITPLPATPSFRDVAYSNGVWIATAASVTTSILRSIDDGLTWATPPKYTVDGNNTAVVGGNGVFVCAGTSGIVQRSCDNGATWATVSTPVANQWRGCCYYNGFFHLVSNNGGAQRGMRSWSRTHPYIREIETVATNRFAQVASYTIANTVTRTSLFGGSVPVSAGRLNFVGQRVSLLNRGRISSVNAHTARFDVLLNGSSVIATVAIPLPALAGVNYRVEANCVVRTVGTAGTLWIMGGFWCATTNSIAQPYFVPFGPMTVAATINTTVANTLDLSLTWGAADPADIVVSDIGEVNY